MQAQTLYILPSLFSFQGASPERKRKPIEREESSDIVGVFNGEGPPVPIPNTEVKLTSAENTCLATDREDRSMPTQKRVIRKDGSFCMGRRLFPCRGGYEPPVFCVLTTCSVSIFSLLVQRENGQKEKARQGRGFRFPLPWTPSLKRQRRGLLPSFDPPCRGAEREDLRLRTGFSAGAAAAAPESMIQPDAKKQGRRPPCA